MNEPERIFREFLRQRKLKFTSERLAILKAAQRFTGPFEAEELLLSLRDSESRISKATVYRTLKHLLETGLVRQEFFAGGKQCHYDWVGEGMGPHDHLLDLDTGRILPFANEDVIKLRDEIARKMGFVALSHHFQITARQALREEKPPNKDPR